jgi:high-affinity Fe2+/Pb2+ permease
MARFGWLRTAGRGLAVAALAVLIIGGLVTDGRVRTTAFALVAVGLLLGFVVVRLGHAHEAGRLPHHLTFAAVFVAGCVVGSHLWEATTGILPDPIAAGIGVGVWVMASWAGSKLVYDGPLDRVLNRVGGPSR